MHWSVLSNKAVGVDLKLCQKQDPFKAIFLRISIGFQSRYFRGTAQGWC